MNVSRGIPAKIQAKAAARLASFHNGDIHARQLKNGFGYALEVGLNYRLLLRDYSKRHDENCWQLVPHELYNKLTRGQRH